MRSCVHKKKDSILPSSRNSLPKLDIISGVEAGLRAVRDDAAVHIALLKRFPKFSNLLNHLKETSRKRKKRP